MLCFWHVTILERGKWIYTTVCTKPVTEVWTRYIITYVDLKLRKVLPYCTVHGVDGTERFRKLLSIYQDETRVRKVIQDVREHFLIQKVP